MAVSAETRAVAPARKRRPYDELVDCDVHPALTRLSDVLGYLSADWQTRLEYLSRQNFVLVNTVPLRQGVYPFGANGLAVDAIPPEGGVAGSSPEFMRLDFFDRYGVDVGQLILLEAIVTTREFKDPAASAAMAAAFNDYMLDRWTADSRMRYAMVVSPRDPDLATAEIARIGSDPRICSVTFAQLEERLGDRRYWPIYAAATAHGLPIIHHVSGARIAGGFAAHYVEERVDVASTAAANITNLVFSGAFERYPELQVMFVEFGFSWIVPHVWRMDAHWRRSRAEVFWLDRPPSQVVHDHITLTSQPVDDDPDAGELYRMIETDPLLSDILVYSSDYPHWDNDRPGAVFQKLPSDVQQKVFTANARRALRL
jgi:predicted TIM-barrel fold metal-dependent hydrolase